MTSEALFVAGYALFLLGLSRALVRLGRISNDPWRSRVLAGYRAQGADVPERTTAGWPHTEVPRLYTALATVAAAAAVLLSLAAALRHRTLADLGVLALMSLLSAACAARLVLALRR